MAAGHGAVRVQKVRPLGCPHFLAPFVGVGMGEDLYRRYFIGPEGARYGARMRFHARVTASTRETWAEIIFQDAIGLFVGSVRVGFKTQLADLSEDELRELLRGARGEQ